MEHWFEPIADHLGAAYLRYSFTKGTVQEVDFLVRTVPVEAGMRVLDVGCGPGRHAHELARRGVTVHGIDISQRFVDLAVAEAPAGATFARADARVLDFADEFDVAISLCQGAFGLLKDEEEDRLVLAGMARAVRPGGRVVLSAFNAYFAVKYQTDAEFDAELGIDHEHTEVRDPEGRAKAVELWTGCYTPRELRLLLPTVGLRVDAVWSVTPGDYATVRPTTDTPELLVLATREA